MTDIFISYSSKDREWVHGLANALEQQGYRVWWDTGLLSGDDFHNTIPEKLAEAACVIVVWTPNSVESLWVKAEANRGLRRNVLIPVMAGDTEIPIPFDMIHTDNFQAWQGDAKSPEFKRLLLSVARYTEPSLLLEQAQREAELEAERHRQALAAEVEEQRRQQAEAEQRKAGQQKRVQAARDAKRREETQRQRDAEQAEREREEREQAEKQRLAEEQRRKDAAAARKAPSDSVQSTPAPTEAASKPSAVASRSPQKASIGKGLTWGGVGTVAMVVALFVWNGRESLFSEQPDAKPTTVGALSKQSTGSTPDASGFQVVADPVQMGKPDFPVPEMVRIEGGSFEMGCVSGKGCSSDEKPVHTVNVPSFEIGKYEVTVGAFKAFVDATGYKTTAEEKGSCYGDKTGKGDWNYVDGNNWKKPGFKQTDNHPVVCVSWKDTQKYIEWLNKNTGKTFRLPTESEWEYAARARTKTPYFWSDKAEHGCDFSNGLDRYSKSVYPHWTSMDCYDHHVYTAPVGFYEPNQFGSVDMVGNVWEWVQDCYHGSYKDAPDDGSAWEVSCHGDDDKVLRGGSWGSEPTALRSAERLRVNLLERNDNFGFRLAKSL